MKRAAGRLAALAVLGLACAAAAICGAGLLYTPNITIPPGFAGELMEVGGVSLRVLQEGTGRDILMIPWLTRNPRGFRCPGARATHDVSGNAL